MGRTKTDDKSSASGNSCKAEAKCRGDDEFSSVARTSTPKKSASDDVKLPKNEIFDAQSVEIKSAGRSSRIRENSRRSILRKQTKAAGNEEEVCTTGKDVVVLNSQPVGSTVASKSEVASSKRQLTASDSSRRRCSNDEKPTFSKRLRPIGLPAVHIQRLSSAGSVLYSFTDSNRRRNTVRKPATTVSTNAVATELSEGQGKNCGEPLDSTPFDEVPVKEEPVSALAIDNEISEVFKVKPENDSDDSGQVKDAADAERKSEDPSGVEVVPSSTKSADDSKSFVQPTDRPRCNAAVGDKLSENKESYGITRSEVASDVDSSCNDVVVLSVENSRARTARRSRNEGANRKRCGTVTDDDSICSVSMPIKQEPCSTESGEAEERCTSVRGTPNKVARTSSKNAEAKTAKKAKSATAKSKQHSAGGSGVSLSVLTRSMIKVPG